MKTEKTINWNKIMIVIVSLVLFASLFSIAIYKNSYSYKEKSFEDLISREDGLNLAEYLKSNLDDAFWIKYLELHTTEEAFFKIYNLQKLIFSEYRKGHKDDAESCICNKLNQVIELLLASSGEIEFISLNYKDPGIKANTSFDPLRLKILKLNSEIIEILESEVFERLESEDQERLESEVLEILESEDLWKIESEIYEILKREAFEILESEDLWRIESEVHEILVRDVFETIESEDLERIESEVIEILESEFPELTYKKEFSDVSGKFYSRTGENARTDTKTNRKITVDIGDFAIIYQSYWSYNEGRYEWKNGVFYDELPSWSRSNTTRLDYKGITLDYDYIIGTDYGIYKFLDRTSNDARDRMYIVSEKYSESADNHTYFDIVLK